MGPLPGEYTVPNTGSSYPVLIYFHQPLLSLSFAHLEGGQGENASKITHNQPHKLSRRDEYEAER